ncbi:MAG: DUF3623 family protein [Candidatus Viridilinea halotolerans]|uniref:DUF3623 family protein n=1 Tax=Candidatus Viridilinea halotolerans TaxID=2491704 RepID=A0A426U5S2_9CHLR|nr:MAG: DUF3623 family protein [Candidatus Viridilinea halotolerans]
MPNLLPDWAQIYIFPPLTAVALWAGLTLLVALLNRRSPWPGRVALVLALPLLGLAHHELWAVRSDSSMLAVYRAFLAGTLIWAWHELAFYSNILTGPWQRPCPSHARGFSRFGYALGTHLYHEIAVFVEVVFMFWLLRDGHNMIGPLVFILSWAMQHSAKLNVLFGVPTLNIELFPPHLRYLGSYWRRRSANFFFIPSTSIITMLAIMLWTSANAHRLETIGVSFALLAALVSLGALEHWLLVAPSRAAQGATMGRIVE